MANELSMAEVDSTVTLRKSGASCREIALLLGPPRQLIRAESLR